MSKSFCYSVAGMLVFCVVNQQVQACPICLDASGSIQKPFFYEADANSRTLFVSCCPYCKATEHTSILYIAQGS